MNKSVEKPISPQEFNHNQSLWKFYPIGMIQGMFDFLQSLNAYLSKDEHKAWLKVEDALSKLDVVVRKNRHPPPKKKK